MSRASTQPPPSPPGARLEGLSSADGWLRLFERASFVVLAVNAVLAVSSPLSFVSGGSEPAKFWWLFLVYGLALVGCLVQVVRGRGAWWLVPGLAIATAGGWLDTWVFDLDRIAGPSLLPLVLLTVLAATALRRRGSRRKGAREFGARPSRRSSAGR